MGEPGLGYMLRGIRFGEARYLSSDYRRNYVGALGTEIQINV